MKLHNPDADLFVPDAAPLPGALERTTHLCIGAHQDDQEFMAYHGIEICHDDPDHWFTGVVVTDGGGSARAGKYADHSDADMRAVRRREQRTAAELGKYSCQLQLAWPSAAVKTPPATQVVEDLRAILAATRPEVVYVHNPADKHDTHVACALHTMQALRDLPVDHQPSTVYGCEVWRDLDWMVDEDKQVMRVDGCAELASTLAAVFDSQLAGGKRYDLAIQGRWRANATMFQSHDVDDAEGLAWAMDLTPLLRERERSVIEHTLAHIDRFRKDVADRMQSLGGQ